MRGVLDELGDQVSEVRDDRAGDRRGFDGDEVDPGVILDPGQREAEHVGQGGGRGPTRSGGASVSTSTLSAYRRARPATWLSRSSSACARGSRSMIASSEIRRMSRSSSAWFRRPRWIIRSDVRVRPRWCAAASENAASCSDATAAASVTTSRVPRPVVEGGAAPCGLPPSAASSTSSPCSGPVDLAGQRPDRPYDAHHDDRGGDGDEQHQDDEREQPALEHERGEQGEHPHAGGDDEACGDPGDPPRAAVRIRPRADRADAGTFTAAGSAAGAAAPPAPRRRGSRPGPSAPRRRAGAAARRPGHDPGRQPAVRAVVDAHRDTAVPDRAGDVERRVVQRQGHQRAHDTAQRGQVDRVGHRRRLLRDVRLEPVEHGPQGRQPPVHRLVALPPRRVRSPRRRHVPPPVMPRLTPPRRCDPLAPLLTGTAALQVRATGPAPPRTGRPTGAPG